jgi:hypothetical protein
LFIYPPPDGNSAESVRCETDETTKLTNERRNYTKTSTFFLLSSTFEHALFLRWLGNFCDGRAADRDEADVMRDEAFSLYKNFTRRPFPRLNPAKILSFPSKKPLSA